MHAETTQHRGAACIRLSAEGAHVLVALHGAHILSWVPADGSERLFLSERARFDGKAAIRGGIPVIFPQFADRGALARHGFARTSFWKFEGVQHDQAIFALSGDGTGAWPHVFIARLCIALSATQIAVTLHVDNTGDTPLSFTAALHTYLRVDDIACTSVDGLQGLQYLDSRKGGSRHLQTNPAVRFEGEIDRIYQDITAPLVVRHSALRLTIRQDGFADAVIWNPGQQLAEGITDLSPGDERRFACVEAAQILLPVTLGAGEYWRGRQFLE